MGCLYKLTSPSGKSYIGISHYGLEKRWAKHVEHALGKRDAGALYGALRKYGTDAFIKEVLAEEDDWDKLCQMEIEAIKSYNTMSPNGYNITAGGEGTVGRKISDQERKNISIAQKKRFQDPEQRRKSIENLAKGREIRKAKCDKIRIEKKIARELYLKSPEYKIKHSEATKKAMANPEIKAKMSALAKARFENPEYKQKMSKINLGRKNGPCSDERKRKISEARKREWADPVIRERRLNARKQAKELAKQEIYEEK